MKLIYDGTGRVIATATDEHLGENAIDAPAEWDGRFEAWRVVDGALVAAVPEAVTPRQAKLALLQAGLLDDAEAAILAIEDDVTKRAAQIEWEYATEFRRDWPTLNALAAGIGLDDAGLDALFVAAAKL